MKKPTEIDRKLLCLRARKKHAEIQRMKKTAFTDPFQLVHEKTVHDRNLTGRPTKTQNADFQPDEHRLIEADFAFGMWRFSISGMVLHRRPAPPHLGPQYGRGLKG